MRHPSVVRVVPDVDALAAAVADLFQMAAAEAVAARGRFAVALSGGRTPTGAYRRLALDSGVRANVPWTRIQFFWSDERVVPPDDPRSNFGEAHRALLGHLPIDAGQVTRVHAELGSAEAVAADYERRLSTWFHLAAGEWPRFDLVLLGMGEDGHTASLFPATAELTEARQMVVPVRRAAPDVDRVSLTLPVLNRAARVAFVVSGATKAAMLARVLDEDTAEADALPARRVRPIDGDLVWLVDRPAVSARSASA